MAVIGLQTIGMTQHHHVAVTSRELWTFGLFVKNRKVNDKAVPFIALASPIISYFLKLYSKELLWGYQFGFEILVVNGLLTFVGLLACSKKVTPSPSR